MNHSSGYLEPLFLQCKITNQGKDLLVFPTYTAEKRPKLEYKHIDSLAWIELEGSEDNPRIKYMEFPIGRKSHNSIPFVFSEGQIHENTLIYSTTKGGDFSSDYVFNPPGRYLVRLKVCPYYSDSSCLYSSEDTLTIKPYRKLEKRALRILNKTETPNFIYEPFITDGLMVFPDFTPQAILLLKKFSNSTFAPWARFYIAFRTLNNNIYIGKLEELIFAQTMVKGILQDPDIENELFKKMARELLFEIEVYIEINS